MGSFVPRTAIRLCESYGWLRLAVLGIVRASDGVALAHWARGGALAWAHLGEGEYRATEDAIQEVLRGDDLAVRLPAPMEPLRATDAPGALVAPPSEEVFPGGSPAEGWEPGPGRAYVVAEPGGALRAGLDGAVLEPVCGSGLIAIAEHPKHERHRLTIEASPGARVWAISFAPGLP